mgnify:CR=1 FL=1
MVSVRFSRIRLANFKCYADADLRLDRGVTVIHGLNGSGKSSLLEACFFALYGSKALNRNLDEIVSIGADDAEVELWFTHAGGDYHVERRIRMTDERATTAKAVLETPEGTYEGARAVRSRVTELLRMDHEAFVNCAYVRQGEVNKLINADASERQDMLDDLLQLGKLEDYRERASDARVGVGRVRVVGVRARVVRPGVVARAPSPVGGVGVGRVPGQGLPEVGEGVVLTHGGSPPRPRRRVPVRRNTGADRSRGRNRGGVSAPRRPL